MFFSTVRIVNTLLLTGLLLVGQTSASQNKPGQKAQTNYIESDRVAPSAFDLPLRIQPDLAGGFAELRVNHLHSGVDFKTQRSNGIPVYAPADGWVSRIRISSFGFGYALYLDHANGFTTVYGHLQGFAEPIATWIKSLQYKRERFELDTLLPIRRVTVQKGQLIAYTGNSGISAAPHLHFEIRDTRTEETIDPLLWYIDRIKDDLAPKPTKIALYAMEGEGVLSTGKEKAIVSVFKNKQGQWTTGVLPTAWGKVGLGLNAYDYMDGNSNRYGVCNIRLFQDNVLIFHQDLSRFNFDQTRYVNAMLDYELVKTSNTWIMKSFVEPGNRLNAYPSLKDWGLVTINEQKKYSFRYELMDRAGNVTVFSFAVQGQKKSIPKRTYSGKKMIFWLPNYFANSDFKLEIPAWSLYRTLDFRYKQASGNGYSDVFGIQDERTPLQQPIQARFRIGRDTWPNKRQYYLSKTTGGNRSSFVPSIYGDGWMEADLKDFGTYTVLLDTVPPKISLPTIERIAKNDVLRIRISDNATGIKSWHGSIDGKWALFALDGKSGWLSCELDSNRVAANRSHEFRLTVKDGCGNESNFSSKFNW